MIRRPWKCLTRLHAEHTCETVFRNGLPMRDIAMRGPCIFNVGSLRHTITCNQEYARALSLLLCMRSELREAAAQVLTPYMLMFVSPAIDTLAGADTI